MWLMASAVVMVSPDAANGQQFPFGGQHQPYRTGTLTPSNYTRAELNQHVASYYDFWKNRWLKPDAAGNGWRVFLDSSGTTVSEGQGYGMVIVAAMAGHDLQAKQIFDGLWQFRLAHPSEIDSRLMDWNVPLATGNDSAFDGDMDIAYGLLMAHAQWGSDGAINYLQQATNVIAGIRASTIGPQSKLPMLGDWVSPNGSTYSQWTTRSSDFMLGHFRAFGEATGDTAYWSGVVTAVQDVITDIQSNESTITGLLPDFIRLVGASRDPQPAQANFLEGPNDGNYWYNAGRDPWRLGVDAILNDDPITLAQVQKLSEWARTSTGGNPNNVRGGYRLDGTPLNTWQDHFFIAPFAVAAMSGNGSADQQWLNALYNHVYQAHSTTNYYPDAVTLQSLLAVTGNMWDPMAVLQPGLLPGDYNHDGIIDAADYTIWRNHLGQSFTLSNENPAAMTPGLVDAEDYAFWKSNFGETLGSGSSATSMANIPEPTTMVLLMLAATSWCVRRGRAA